MRRKVFFTIFLGLCLLLNLHAQDGSQITTWGGGKMALVDSDMERSLDGYKNWVAMFDVGFNIVTREDNARSAVVLDFNKTNDPDYLRIWNRVDSLNQGYVERTLKPEFCDKKIPWGNATSDSLYIDFHYGKELSSFLYYRMVDELIIEVKRLSEPFVVELDSLGEVTFPPFEGKNKDLSGVWDLGPLRFVLMESNHKVLSSFEDKMEVLKGKKKIGYVWVCDARMRKQQRFLYFMYWVEENELCLFSEKSPDSPKLMFRIPFELSKDGKTFYIKLHKMATTLKIPNNGQ
ncbi:MAG: hypothetical protein MJZ14_04055 [Paludibacteraceae bacterium]|nr:hypothetical protein [Paludibacteraceae bacterium]